MVWRCLWCLSRQSLFNGVVYNLFARAWLRWFILLARFRDVFTAYNCSTYAQHCISSSGSAYAYAGVCINPAVGFHDRMDITAGLSFVPYARSGAGRRRGPRYFTANPGLGLAVDLCGYWHRSTISGYGKRRNLISYWSLFNSVFWRFSCYSLSV